MRPYHLVLVACLAACDMGTRGDQAKQDTTTLPASATRDSLRSDSATGLGASSGVPAVPGESAAAAAAALDTGIVLLAPQTPRRGGVVFVLAPGLATELPRCTWKGEPLPCYRSTAGVRAFIPLPVDDPPGTYTVTIDRPGGRLSRQITVTDHEVAREIVFLRDSLYALLRRRSDVARDARALRQVLGAQTPESHWQGRWRDPVAGGRSSAYGVERFYFPASDSTRVVTLPSGRAARGTFSTDTAARAAADVPGWRHAGLDLAVRQGTPVQAPAAGIVNEVGDYILSGRTLVLDHGQGVQSAYFHLDTVLVQRGDVVRAGTSVGRVGRTGLATGPHLHYGIYIHGQDVDPMAWREMPAFARGDSAAAAAVRAGGKATGSR